MLVHLVPQVYVLRLEQLDLVQQLAVGLLHRYQVLLHLDIQICRCRYLDKYLYRKYRYIPHRGALGLELLRPLLQRGDEAECRHAPRVARPGQLPRRPQPGREVELGAEDRGRQQQGHADTPAQYDRYIIMNYTFYMKTDLTIVMFDCLVVPPLHRPRTQCRRSVECCLRDGGGETVTVTRLVTRQVAARDTV